MAIRVVLEQGKNWTFASALDWPGWGRRAKGGADEAIEALVEYGDRYAAVVAPRLQKRPTRPSVEVDVRVVETTQGSGTTDFGAPGTVADADRERPTDAQLEHHLACLEACWAAFDAAFGAAPDVLPKGPRGGGRDREPIAAHTAEAERSYLRSLGIRLKPGTPWPDQRATALEGLRDGSLERRWPLRYGIRRIAWHVLDHAWELEDKSGH